MVPVGERLGDDPVESCALEPRKPVDRDVAIARRRCEIHRRVCFFEHAFERGAPITERHVEQRVIVEREEIERDVRRGDLGRELRHARRGGVLAQLQRVEVEAALVRDDDLTVERDSIRKLRKQWFA